MSQSDNHIRGLDGRLRLTPVQRRIIESLRQRDGQTRRDLKVVVRTSQPGLARALNCLHRAGLIDFHGTIPHLTEEGRRG